MPTTSILPTLRRPTGLLAFNGRFAAPGQPWIRRDGDRFWLDVEVLAAHLPGPWSSGERRVLQVVELEGEPRVVPGLASVAAAGRVVSRWLAGQAR